MVIKGPIPEERFDDVIAHLRVSFFADEPLNKSVQLCARGEPHRELEEHARHTMRDNLSEMAYDVTTNQVTSERRLQDFPNRGNDANITCISSTPLPGNTVITAAFNDAFFLSYLILPFGGAFARIPV